MVLAITYGRKAMVALSGLAMAMYLGYQLGYVAAANAAAATDGAPDVVAT